MVTLLFGLAALVGVVAIIWLVAVFVLLGQDHNKYDRPRHPSAGTRTAPSDEHNSVVQIMIAGAAQMPKLSRKKRLSYMRQQLDQMGESAPINATIRSVDAAGVKAEWVLAPGVPTTRRLLYLHGGAFTMGSPTSHRPITSKLSELAQSSVLAIDYRLMPEHSRLAGIDDCRNAYRWILDHAPQGPDDATELDSLIVAGDSAGGNLTLSLIAWARDTGLRAADAAVALSPATDATFASPSLIKNAATDTMLGPMFGPIAKLPRVLTLWFSLVTNRIKPNNPLVSPLHGDLNNLPPTLVQASEAEMLLDDAVRYVNKANAAASHAELQTWPFMLHVWHAFAIPEAQEAFENIGRFLAAHTSDAKHSTAPREVESG